MTRLSGLNAAVLLAAIGYGITFPLLAIRLQNAGASGFDVGLNAAGPALGWVLGSAIVPQLQRRCGIKAVTLGFLTLGLFGLAALASVKAIWAAALWRFVFGGAVGLFFRNIEYWVNQLSLDDTRGRNLSINNVVFMLGLVVGGVVQPQLGTEGWMAFAPTALFLILSAVVIAASKQEDVHHDVAPAASGVSALYVAAAPTAAMAMLVYGLYESIPAYMTEIYALRNGLGETVAAFALSAAALGSILVPIPVGMMSDVHGRRWPLLCCAVTVALVSLLIPLSLTSPALFLVLVAVWGGAASTVYSLALTIIGDRYRDADLVAANATWGIIYAMGSLFGPLINGIALDTFNSHGVMLSAAGLFGILIPLLGGRGVRTRGAGT